jgi:uncharacterized protein
MNAPARSGPGTVVRYNVGVDTSDGVRLATDIYRPTEGGQVVQEPRPVVIERTPYDRGRASTVELAKQATRRGYVFVAQDVRGRGQSGGNFRLYMSENDHDEGSDGADTMRWIARQPWCDGRIAAVGGSFGAANMQAAALHHPEGLRVQFLRDGGINYYERALRTHGTTNVGLCVPWVVNQAATSPEAQRDPYIAQALQQMRTELPKWVARFPWRRGESPLALCPAYEDLLFSMYETGDDVPFWHSTTARLEGHWDEYPTDVAVLMVSGWYAHHVTGNFTKLKELGARLDRPVSLIVGPWVHSPGMLEDTVSGDADFGPAAAEFGSASDACFDWLDNHLPEDESRARTLHPPLRYFRMGTGDGHRTPEGRIFHGGEWHSAQEWPLPGTSYVPYYFAPGGLLSPQAPGEDGGTTEYDFDPASPCPTVGATNLQDPGHPSLFVIGPQDQRVPAHFLTCRRENGPLADRPDVITFATERLAEPTEVTGPVEVVLWCASDATDTDFVAKLIDVYPPSEDYPQGYSMLLCEDIVRMRYRGNRPVGELIEPGRPYEVTLPIGPTSNVFKAGHRIRVDITSSSFPEYDVNPNTGEPLGRHTRTEVAHQTIHHDALMPSHVMLPIQPDERAGA